ncbi:hypothetical protein EB796_001442 [Bugula neritina]|uniref:Uncharacterized protein n=1 Tax=Bugula neritina TaxID=10212 RepID=A0A7J7KQ09_BUGNE|nr:hypothetical protein EB796_001442 [Bugula neritina]
MCMLMQYGDVSSYMYEILILAMCVAVNHDSDKSSNSTEHLLSLLPSPHSSTHNFIVNSLKRIVDGLRSGTIQSVEIHSSLNDMLQNCGATALPQQLKIGVNILKTQGAELIFMLKALEKDFMSSDDSSLVVVKVLNFLFNPTSDKKDNKDQACAADAAKQPEDVAMVTAAKANVVKKPQVKLADDKPGVSRRTYLLTELNKDAMARLDAHLNKGLFTDSQLQTLSDILYNISDCRDNAGQSLTATTLSPTTEKSNLEQSLSQMLTAIKILVNTPAQNGAAAQTDSAAASNNPSM